MSRISYQRITRYSSTGHRRERPHHNRPRLDEFFNSSTRFAVPLLHLAIILTRLLRRQSAPITVLGVPRLLKANGLFVIVTTGETRAGRGVACGW